MNIRLSEEQQIAVEKALNLPVLKINALAGAGKSTTAFAIIKEALKKNLKVLYAVYNRSIMSEAKELSKKHGIDSKNLWINTAHGLAFHLLSKKRYFEKSTLGNIEPFNLIKSKIAKDLESALNILHIYDIFLLSEFHLDQVEDFFECMSTDINFSDIINNFDITPKLIDLITEKIEKNELPCSYNFYVKKCLTLLVKREIRLYFDMIIIDEAQDISLAIFNLAKTLCRKNLIILGDKHQSIYDFMGTTNILEYLQNIEETYLTYSFRLSEKVAETANEILTKKGEKNLIKSKKMITPYKNMGIISRTNEELINFYSELPKNDQKKSKFERGIEEIFKLPFTFSCILNKINPYDLCKEFKIKTNKILNDFMYNTLIKMSEDEIFTYLQKLLLNGINLSYSTDLATAFRVAQDLTPVQILDIIREYYSNTNKNKEIFLGTVHSSKGMEYQEVIVLKDLQFNQKYVKNNLNLLYTAVTRASEKCAFK